MFTIILVTNLLVGPADVHADDFQKEDALKVAFIYHFVQFVEWPADRPETITIGLLGEDPFNGALQVIHGKTVNGQSIRIKQLLSTDRSIDEIQVLVVGRADDDAVASILASAASQPVLTIADLDVFKVEGVIISLFRRETRQKFNVNQKAAKKAGLTLSSQLLQISTSLN